ncbi:hypothetical protein HMPREF9418_0449 [Neisseria macacae ATCC 33926]|uniref:Uncharacterized protein n=1 Tax=Neisseria macacae ATCC 33926 TaxID=997348 RepID=A0AA36ULH5_9NEIS|nr:hypothetical protein HMPREF9418_0449 [Neisseria macacae ATCC 33926]
MRQTKKRVRFGQRQDFCVCRALSAFSDDLLGRMQGRLNILGIFNLC